MRTIEINITLNDLTAEIAKYAEAKKTIY